MKVLEIFSSVQGEGLRAGEPSCFIRLSGCNFTCPFCDTQEDMTKKPMDMSSKEILQYIRASGDIVTAFVITGGEPLLQKSELRSLLSLLTGVYPRAFITIETNGSIRIPENLTYFKNILWSISPKFSKECGVRNVSMYTNILQFNLRIAQKAQLKLLYDDTKGTLEDLLLHTAATLLMDNPNVDVIVQPLMPSIGGDAVEHIRKMVTQDNIKFYKKMCEYPFKSLRLVGQLHKVYDVK